MKFSLSKLSVVLCYLSLLMVFSTAFAADGIISPTDNRACFKTSLYECFNFALAQGNVIVSDTAMTGYAWSSTFGWITLSPSTGGIINDGAGNLSGYAWGQRTGWINFYPSNAGTRVTIDGNGDFHGYAWSQNVGWISFNCLNDSTCGTLNFKLNTTWRPATTTATTSTSTPTTTPSGGGGGIFVNESNHPVVSPQDSPSFDQPQTTVPRQNIPSAQHPEVLPPAPENVSFPPEPDMLTQPTTETNGGILTNKIFVPHVNYFLWFGIIAIAGLVARFLSFFIPPKPFSAADFIHLPLRIWSLWLGFIGLRKRLVPWGTVYDSVTKEPLDPAYVILQDTNNTLYGEAITDLDGRYGFVAPQPNTYTIVANKTHYAFPSIRLKGQTSDELYNDLYFGEPFTINETGEIILKNVPLDPVEADWNQTAKIDKHLMTYFSKHELLWRRITDWLFIIGFIYTIVALILSPVLYNFIIISLYIVLGIFYSIGIGPKPFGTVIEKSSGMPISYAVLHIFFVGIERELMSKVCDKFGRYYCLMPNGTCYVRIDKKNPDGSYTPIYTSAEFKVRTGIVNKVFKV